MQTKKRAYKQKSARALFLLELIDAAVAASEAKLSNLAFVLHQRPAYGAGRGSEAVASSGDTASPPYKILVAPTAPTWVLTYIATA